MYKRQVQKLCNAGNAVCMDINAACSGFLYALATAHAYIQSGICTKALVIGAERLSGVLDWNDRSTCVLFGDCLLYTSVWRLRKNL